MSKGGIFFVAAGSGGHVYAAVATYRRFIRDFPTLSKDILFIGSTLLMEGDKNNLPIEERIANHHNIPFEKIWMGKFQRKLTLQFFKNLFLIIVGFFDALRIIVKHKPRVIVAFGGYVSLPIVIVGKILGIKTIIHEQTSSIGLTNKVLQYFSDKIAITFPTSKKFFKKDVILVGSPTMRHIYDIKDYKHLYRHLEREKSVILNDDIYLGALEKLEKSKKRTHPLLLVSGGSQGSHFLNKNIKKMLPELLRDWTVFIQTGENEYYKDYGKIKEYLKTLPADLANNCIVRKFIFEEFGYLMRNADLFIGRSGANTVYQVGMNKLKSIFVPIPWVVNNEQYTNAKILEDAGYATILDQEKLTPESILKEIKKMKDKDTASSKEVVFPTNAAEMLAKQIAVLAV